MVVVIFVIGGYFNNFDMMQKLIYYDMCCLILVSLGKGIGDGFWLVW